MMVVLEEGKLMPNRYICLQKSMQTLHYGDPEGRTCDPEWLKNGVLNLSFVSHSLQIHKIAA